MKIEKYMKGGNLMLKIAVCDDNKLELEQLVKMIESKLENNCRVISFTSGYALEIFVDTQAKGNVEIIFLDIHLKDDCDGIEIAKRIKKKYQHIKIVFVTGYIDYSRRIFASDPDYFLVKPFIEEELAEALNVVVKKYEEDSRDVITFSTGRYFVNIKHTKIAYIESFDREVWLHLNNDEIKISEKMDDLEKKLPPNFLRCHQSYIVNMDFIEGQGFDYFTLYNKNIVYISQSKRKLVKQTVKEWVKNNI